MNLHIYELLIPFKLSVIWNMNLKKKIFYNEVYLFIQNHIMMYINHVNIKEVNVRYLFAQYKIIITLFNYIGVCCPSSKVHIQYSLYNAFSYSIFFIQCIFIWAIQTLYTYIHSRQPWIPWLAIIISFHLLHSRVLRWYNNHLE